MGNGLLLEAAIGIEPMNKGFAASKVRDRLNINVEQVQSESDEMIGRFREHPGLLNPVSRMLLKE